jgi:hypothetical protein
VVLNSATRDSLHIVRWEEIRLSRRGDIGPRLIYNWIDLLDGLALIKFELILLDGLRIPKSVYKVWLTDIKTSLI